MQLPVVCPFASLPVRRSAHRAPSPGPNPNERRGRACPPAPAPPTPAGRGPSSRQSSARSPAIAARNAPRRGHTPKGACLGTWQCRGPPGRQWPDSSVTAATGPPVPTSPGGRQPTPQDRAALAPGGAQAGAARPRAGGSGCATQGEPRGPSSALRTGLAAADSWDPSINQTQSPARTLTSECLALGHAALGC